jgi:putative ABC transport system permease protein
MLKAARPASVGSRNSLQDLAMGAVLHAGALVREARYSIRSLRRRPLYALAVTAILALATGAATAVFHLVDATLIRPLPFRDQQRLVTLWWSAPNNPLIEVSYPDFLDLQTQTRAFAHVAAYGSVNWNTVMTGYGEPVNLPFAAVSSSFFEVVGTPPLIGRRLFRSDERPGAPRVAVLSHRLWRERFGSDRAAIGRPVSLDGRVFTIAGVMPPAFDYPRGAKLWMALGPYLEETLSQDARDNLRNIGFLYVLARLAPGVTIEAAQVETTAWIKTLAPSFFGGQSEQRATLTPLVDHILGPTRPALLLLFAAVALVLFLACTNVAGMALVRASGREREMSIRVALGASPGHLLTLLLAESLLLCAAAVVGAILTALFWLRGFEALAPSVLDGVSDVALDGRAMSFAIAVSIAVAVVAGMWPIMHRTGGSGSLRVGAESTGPTLTGRFLIAAEIALTLTVLTAASLAARSFFNLRALDVGYTAARVLLVDVPIGSEKQPVDKTSAYARQIAATLATLPGVEAEAVGGVSLKPLAFGPIGDDARFQLEGQQRSDIQQNPGLSYLRVTPGYFSAIGMRLLAGRLFTEADIDAAPPVAIVTEITALRLWGRTDVVGRKLRVFRGSDNDPFTTIVGVVATLRHRELAEPRLDLFTPAWSVKTWAVRTTARPESIAGAVRTAIRQLDPNQPIEITTLEGLVEDARKPWTFTSALLSAFAALALLLAASGVHALVAYAVSIRTKEFAVRMALGATRRDIILDVFRGIGDTAAFGIAAGIPLALIAARSMRTLLFGIVPLDIISFVTAAALLALAVSVACYLPARRAADVDPLAAIRSE